MLKTNKSVVNSLLGLQSAWCLPSQLIRSRAENESTGKAGITDSPKEIFILEKSSVILEFLLLVCEWSLPNKLSEFLKVLQVPKATSTHVRAAKAVITTSMLFQHIHSFV